MASIKSFHPGCKHIKKCRRMSMDRTAKAYISTIVRCQNSNSPVNSDVMRFFSSISCLMRFTAVLKKKSIRCSGESVLKRRRQLMYSARASLGMTMMGCPLLSNILLTNRRPVRPLPSLKGCRYSKLLLSDKTDGLSKISC